MKKYRWYIAAAAGLVGLSALFYFVHYLIFGDPHHIFIYLIGDIAFVPLEVLLVALVIERLLARRERNQLMQKMNMVIGTFFSELGTELLGRLTGGINSPGELRRRLGVGPDWSAKDYQESLAFVRDFDFEVNVDALDLVGLLQMLKEKEGLLLLLLANPNLLEREHFTELLWAVFHLMEELDARDALDDLPDTDKAHVAGDVRRVYARLTAQWLLYCQHLQAAYPYIFSIVVRTHPLQENPSATVT
jgi:hypothetical protein